MSGHTVWRQSEELVRSWWGVGDEGGGFKNNEWKWQTVKTVRPVFDQKAPTRHTQSNNWWKKCHLVNKIEWKWQKWTTVKESEQQWKTVTKVTASFFCFLVFSTSHQFSSVLVSSGQHPSNFDAYHKDTSPHSSSSWYQADFCIHAKPDITCSRQVEDTWKGVLLGWFPEFIMDCDNTLGWCGAFYWWKKVKERKRKRKKVNAKSERKWMKVTTSERK